MIAGPQIESVFDGLAEAMSEKIEGRRKALRAAFMFGYRLGLAEGGNDILSKMLDKAMRRDAQSKP